MMHALAFLIVANLEFEERTISDLEIRNGGSIVAEPAANFIHADLNGDGLADLLFQNGAKIQGSSKEFSETFAFPAHTSPGQVDAWKDTIYVRSPQKLFLLHFSNTDWETTQEIAFEWPRTPVSRDEHSSNRLSSFLYDINDDDSPEMVLVTQDALHVYRVSGGTIVEQAAWQVIPPLRLLQPDPQPLWPEATRRLTVPTWQIAARIYVHDAHLYVVTQESLAGQQVRYHESVHTVSFDTFALLSSPEIRQTPELPSHMRPCRVNADDIVDYAGTQFEASTIRVLSAPMLRLSVSLDSGRTSSSWRLPALPQRNGAAQFIDWNHDGLQDLILARSHAFDGGIREILAKALTREAVDETIQIHLQGPAGLPRDPQLELRVQYDLDAPPFRTTADFQEYLRGQKISFFGNFDGDSWNDLAVRTDPETIRIYLTTEAELSRSPLVTVPVAAEEMFAVYDVDADGKADLVLKRRGSTNGEPSRVLFGKGIR